MTRLITVQYIKDYSNADANIQSKQIEIAIDHAQLFYLQQILGTALYNKMLTDFGSYAGDYSTLYTDYIKPYLLYRVMVDLRPMLNYQLRNKGLMQFTSQDAQGTDLKDLMYMVQKDTDQSQFCAKRMTDYLCGNSSLFPEYTATQDDGGLAPDKDAYYSTLFAGNRRGGNPNTSLYSHWSNYNSSN